MGLIRSGQDRLIVLFQPVQQIIPAPFIQLRQCFIKQQQRSGAGMFPHPFDFRELQGKKRGTDLSPGSIGTQVDP